MYEYENAWIMTAQLNEKKDGCELCMRPLVLCKDCKHWEQSNGHCPFNSIFTNGDWFCADGERVVKS